MTVNSSFTRNLDLGHYGNEYLQNVVNFSNTIAS